MKNKIIIFSSNNSNGSTLIARFYSYFLSLLNYKVCMVNVSNIVKLINMDSSNDGKYSKNYLFFSKNLLSAFFLHSIQYLASGEAFNRSTEMSLPHSSHSS